jgi:DNA-damage-inducible protein J
MIFMQNQTTILSIRMDKAVKEQSDILFSELGMTLTTAINIFVRQSLRARKIPFEITLNENNEMPLETAVLKEEGFLRKRRRGVEMEEG